MKGRKVVITSSSISHSCALHWGCHISLITLNCLHSSTDRLISSRWIKIGKSALANLSICHNILMIIPILSNPPKCLWVVKVASLHAHSLKICCVCAWISPTNHVKGTLKIAHAVISTVQILLTRAFVRSSCICNTCHTYITISWVITSLCCPTTSTGSRHTSSRIALSIMSAVSPSH